MPRRPFDRYETPPHYVAALLDLIGEPRGKILEPCAGRNHIAYKLSTLATRPNVFTNDIDKTVDAGYTVNHDWHRDARTMRSWEHWRSFDWIITNPPFSDELRILRLALRSCPNVAMLARLSFLEPTPTNGRAHFWEKYVSTCEVIVLPRYSFTQDGGSDSMTCCWLVWRGKHPRTYDLGFGLNGFKVPFSVSQRREAKP